MLPPGAMVSFGPGLLLKTISEFMALFHPGSVLVSMAPETIKNNADARGMGFHLGQCWCLRTMVPLWQCLPEWPMLPTSGHSDIQVWATIENHVYVHDTTSARFFFDFDGP